MELKSTYVCTDADRRAELRMMLADECLLTLGGFAALHTEAPDGNVAAFVAANPGQARRLLRRADWNPRKFAVDFARELAAAEQAFAVVNAALGGADAPKETRPGISAEWLCNVAMLATRWHPGVTWRELLWNTPLVTVAHWCAASLRMGGRETRPLEDFSEAFAAMKDVEPFEGE